MSVSAAVFSVIVRNATLEEKFPGGVKGFRQLCPNRTFCTDGQISRVGFMNEDDAHAFIAQLAAAGLEPFKENVSVDVALTDPLFGSHFNCDWLEMGNYEHHPLAQLRGAEPADIFIPQHEYQAKTQLVLSRRELRDFYVLVKVEGNVEHYRHKTTGAMIYVGRTQEVAPPRKWWRFWK